MSLYLDCYHPVTFSSVSNFIITLYVRSLFSDYILGTLKFVPVDEVTNNVRNKELQLHKGAAEKTDVMGNMSSLDPQHLVEGGSKGGLHFWKFDSEEPVEIFLLLGGEPVIQCLSFCWCMCLCICCTIEIKVVYVCNA